MATPAAPFAPIIATVTSIGAGAIASQVSNNIYSTKVNNERLISLIILITLSYSYSTFIGEKIKRKGISEYLVRPTEKGKRYKRCSDFSIGLNALKWLSEIWFFQEQLDELTWRKHRVRATKCNLQL